MAATIRQQPHLNGPAHDGCAPGLAGMYVAIQAVQARMVNQRNLRSMHVLFCLSMLVWMIFGSPRQDAPSINRPSTEFLIVEARFEQPTAALEKKLTEIDALLKAGKISAEQADKRRSQAQKSQKLLLFGYFGKEPRVIEVQRADADSAGWNAKEHPASIRFEQIPPVRGAAKLLDTPLSAMPRKGWEAVGDSVAPEAKYRLHPWLQQPGARLLKASLPVAIRTTRYVPASSGSVGTSFGTFNSGGSPQHWVVVVSLSSSEAEPFVGLFTLVDSVGKSLGRVEIDRPLQPGEHRDVEIVAYQDPRNSQGLTLQSVIARTSPTVNQPHTEPADKSLEQQ
jgi:hypothetical protein